MPIYDRKMETLSRGALEQLQLERLQITLNRVVRNVAFYRQQFDSRRIDTLSIKSLDDLRRLPFTTKDDVRMGSPYDMFAVPLRDIVRVQCSAGTTGDPVGVGYGQRHPPLVGAIARTHCRRSEGLHPNLVPAWVDDRRHGVPLRRGTHWSFGHSARRGGAAR